MELNLQYIIMQKYYKDICNGIFNSKYYKEIKNLTLHDFYNMNYDMPLYLNDNNLIYKDEYNNIIKYILKYIINNKLYSSLEPIESIFKNILIKYYNYKEGEYIE